MQQTINFHAKVHSVTINEHRPEQSKDEIMKFREEPDVADEIKARCFDMGISVSEFLRTGAAIARLYPDVSVFKVLIENSDVLFPMLQRLSKKF